MQLELNRLIASVTVFFCHVICVVLLFSCLNLVWLVIVGSAITGPIGKECADLWPRIASAANAIV